MGVWARLGGHVDGIADAILNWDRQAVESFGNHPALQRFSKVFFTATYMGDGYLWGGLGLGLILFGRAVDRWNVLIGLAVSIVNIALFRFLKLVFARARPVVVSQGLRSRLIDTYSFPSGHATTSFGLAWVVSSSYPHPAIQVGAYLAAGVISISRVYVREHFPLDVMVGAALGSLVAACLVPFFRWLGL